MIKDLFTVLKDAENRFFHFDCSYAEREIGSEKLYFPIHAILLLSHLGQNINSQLLELLKYDSEVVDLWFGKDILDQLYRPIILKEIHSNLINELFEFMKYQPVDEYSRALVADMLVYAIHKNKAIKREDKLSYHSELLNYYIKTDYYQDSFLALYVCELMDAGYQELLPLVMQLHDLDRIDLSVYGTYQDLEEQWPINSDSSIREIEKFNNLEHCYKHFAEWYDCGNTPIAPPKNNSNNHQQKNNSPVKSINDIGRNDSCYCGSGKKYKKCCML